jgi:hypothetical protein
MLQCPMMYNENRVSAMPFVYFLRFYVGMSPLIKRGRVTQAVSECDGAFVPECDRVKPPHRNRGYVEEVCALNHGHQCGLGPTAAHCIHCPSTYTARSNAHNGYARVVNAATNRLQCIPAQREPKTTTVLMDEFTYDECRALCPKVLTVEKSALAKTFHGTMLRLASLNLEGPGAQAEMLLIQNQIAEAIASLGDAAKGVRLDMSIELLCGKKDLLVDFSGVHSTAVATMAKLKHFTTALTISDTVSGGVVANNPTARIPSPAVVAAEELKRRRYATLMDIANRQFDSGKRERRPVLLPAIITHMGELGPGFITLIEELTACAGRQYRPNTALTCGRSRAQTTAAFRTRLKDALMVANAEGFGKALMAAGTPMGGWVCAPDDADLGSWDVMY